MRLLTTIAISLLFISCGPSDGDKYENEYSGREVEVMKIGNCVELENHFVEEKERVRENYKTGKISGFAYEMVKTEVIPEYQDSAANCIGYASGMGRRTIEERDDFLRSHTKLNRK